MAKPGRQGVSGNFRNLCINMHIVYINARMYKYTLDLLKEFCVALFYE